MTHVLAVPMRVDALIVRSAEQVVGPIADFTNLPQTDPLAAGGPRQVNPDIAFIGENVLSEPFQERNTTLGRGVHLHFALPAALSIATRPDDADPDDPALAYPSVPNRWLIARRGGGLDPRHWVIESDYLWPEGTPWVDGRVSYPVLETANEGPRQQPYRYLGCRWPGEAWEEDRNRREHLDQLIALGYGEPTFAAAYANCRGVFGMHDREVDPSVDVDGLHYDIVGWYADEHADFLRQHDAGWSPQTDERGEVTETISHEFGWTVEGALAAPPEHMVCVGAVELGGDGADAERPTARDVTVAVASTGTEALSTVLASEFADGDDDSWREIEHQLEALHLTDALSSQRLDLGPRFAEARHTKTFHSVPGGTVWRLRPAPVDGARDAAGDSAATPNVAGESMPSGATAAITRINRLQARVDRATADVASLRRQVFSDWIRYITCRYRPADDGRSLPRVDDVRLHLQRMIAALELRIARLEASGRLARRRLADDLDAARSIGADRLTSSVETEFKDWLDQQPRGVASSSPLLREDLEHEVAETTSLLARLISIRATAAELSALIAAAPARGEHSDLATQLTDHLAQLPDEWKTVELDTIAQALAAVSTADAPDWSGLTGPLDDLGRLPAVTLTPTEAPRYWQPNDPVILLAGPGVGAPDRLRDGQPRCQLLDLTGPPGIWGDASGPRAVLTAIDAASFVGVETAGEPWHPLYVEWEVVVEPCEDHTAHPTGRYPTDFIEKHFRLAPDEPVFVAASRASSTRPTRSYFSGRAVLSPHAGTLLTGRIDDYLARQVTRYLDAQSDSAQHRTRDQLLAHLHDSEQRTAFLDWLVTTSGSDQPVRTFLAVHERLTGFEVQTQALGGFNESLLMQREVLQFHPVDPLGYGPDREFARATVRPAVVGHNHTSPLPNVDFHPITTGRMAIRSLRLIDTFGRSLSLDTDRVMTTWDRTSSPGWRQLPPRVTQPARLNFRWLSANDPTDDAVEHPSTSPVCGWILPNEFDHSLMVYDGAGSPVGLLDAAGRWHPPPGRPGPDTPADIPDRSLSSMVEWLARQSQRTAAVVSGSGERQPQLRFMSDVIDVLQTAVENIDPETYAELGTRALLVGRPLALVRASIDIEVHGLPAIDQSWDSLDRALRGSEFDHKGFIDVRIPLRLGEHGQLNDGVVGYWVETEDGYALDRLLLPQSEPLPDADRIDHISIGYEHGREFGISQAISDPPVTVSILLDPRGSVHCTSGVLPTKVLRLPPAHYADVMRALEVTFTTGPVLTGDHRMEVPTPSVHGWGWSWLQQRSGGWQRLDTTPTVHRDDVIRAFPDGQTVWSRLVEHGWISPVGGDLAEIAPANHRTPISDPAIDESDVARLLDVAAQVLVQPAMRARFGSTTINEGWLALRRTGDTPAATGTTE